MTQVTEHFTLEEFTISSTADRLGIDNSIPSQLMANMARTAGVMELVRLLLGNKSVIVTSGYRSPELNKAVGGVPGKSAHLAGLACDFICPAFGSPLAVCKALSPHTTALKFDQLIYEYSWVHIGLASPGDQPRQQLLTLMKDGSYQYGIISK